MKFKKLFVFLSLLALVSVSCKKGHYDVDNLQGVNVDGEVLMPIGSSSFTVMDLMQQFEIDSMINCTEDGNLSFTFHYEDLGVLKGADFLQFKDAEYSAHLDFENPYPFDLPYTFDTVFKLEETIVFESDNIHVMKAEMKSGHFDIDLTSNVGLLQRVVLRSPNLKDNQGNDLMLDFDLNSSEIQFDLEGLNYVTATANTLDLNYEVYVKMQSTPDPELYFDATVIGSDLALKNMMGFVDPYESRSCIDTTINLFPGSVSGALEVYGARMKIFGRNTFGMEARLDIDTAWVITDDQEPFPIFGPDPVMLDFPTQYDFEQVFDHTLNGKLSANETGVYAATGYVVNPSGVSEMVSVADDCVIDVMIDTEIPFEFKVDDVCYSDTTSLDLEIKEIDQIEKLTLEMTFTSTMPINMNAQFFSCDSETGLITDTLLTESRLIRASFDGQPVTTEVTLEITEDKIEPLLRSGWLISRYELDTEAQTAVLKAQQSLDVMLKARLKYKGIVEFNNEE